jgi:hypothetical protein
MGKDAPQFINYLKWRMLYELGQFEDFKKALEENKSEDALSLCYQPLIELGRMEEAAKSLEKQREGPPNHFQCMAMAVGWHLAGNTAEFNRWKELAAQSLEKQSFDRIKCAEYLRSSTPPELVQLEELMLDVQEKALFVTLLACQHPSKKAEFNALARALAVDRTFPYHLIQKATQ